MRRAVLTPQLWSCLECSLSTGCSTRSPLLRFTAHRPWLHAINGASYAATANSYSRRCHSAVGGPVPYVAGMARAIRQSPKLKTLALCANQLHAACINALLTGDEGLLHAGVCSAAWRLQDCGTIGMPLLHCIALHCIALHCIALHCIALHCIACEPISRLHCVSVCLLQRRPRSGCCSST